MHAGWEASESYAASPDTERQNVQSMSHYTIYTEHLVRVKAARHSHAERGRSHSTFTFDSLADLKEALLRQIFAHQQDYPDALGVVTAGFEQDFSACQEKLVLSRELFPVLLRDDKAFQRYCSQNISFSQDAHAMQNDLHRILQHREAMVQLFMADKDLFSETHRRLLRDGERGCLSCGRRIVTVIAQVDANEQYDGPNTASEEEYYTAIDEFLLQLQCRHDRFDQFYAACGYSRVHADDFSRETAAHEPYAVYSKNMQ